MDKQLFEFETDALMTSPNAWVKPAKSLTAATTPRRGSRRYARLNRRTAIFVGACVFVTPIPIAMNRPSLWMIWVVLTALITVLYMLLCHRAEPTRPLLSGRFKWLFGLALAIPGFALLQSLPIGDLLPLNPNWPITSFPEAMLDIRSISLIPSASLVGALRFTGYILFAALVIEISGRPDRATTLGWAIFWCVAAHALWGVAALRLLGDIALFGEKTAYLGSATGTFINRNSFATFLGMGSVLGLALILDRSNRARMRRARPLSLLRSENIEAASLWLALAVIYLALLLTESRLGVAASVLGTVVCIVMMRFKSGAKPKATLGVALAITVALCIVILATVGQGVLERSVFLAKAFEGRLNGYSLSLDLISTRPWLGYGLDAFRPAFEMVHVPPMAINVVWDRAHSTYLTHWIELGVIAGSLPIVLGLIVVWRLIDILRRRTVDFALSVGTLAALVVAATHSVMDFSLEMPSNVVLLIAIVGLGITHRAHLSNMQTSSPSETEAAPQKCRKRRRRKHAGGHK